MASYSLVDSTPITKKYDSSNKLRLGRKALERLDLLLLTIESLDLNSSQSMLYATKQLGLSDQFPNAVELWKKRCLNPLRRSTRRGAMTLNESEGLIILISSMANKLYPLLRQLLSSKEPESLNHQRWNLLTQRFTELTEERMNTRRIAVQKLLDAEYTKRLNREMIMILALSSGTGGVDRLRSLILENV